MTSIPKYLKLCFAFVIFTGYANNPSKKEVSQDTISKSNDIVKQNGSDQDHFFDRLIWTTDLDTVRHDFVLKKNREVNADTLTPKKSNRRNKFCSKLNNSPKKLLSDRKNWNIWS